MVNILPLSLLFLLILVLQSRLLVLYYSFCVGVNTFLLQLKFVDQLP